MKTILSKIAAMTVAFSVCYFAKAQDVPMAILQHEEQVTAYYGINAFNQAMNNAQQGDLISLSAGIFNGTEIKNAVVIQGAGYVMNPEKERFRTSIISDIIVNIPDNQLGLCIEGIYSQNLKIYSNVTNFIIRKCFFENIRTDSDNTNKKCQNGKIDQSYISNFQIYGSENIIMLNKCVVNTLSSWDTSASISIKNCVINDGRNCSGLYENNIMFKEKDDINSSYYNNVIRQPLYKAQSMGNYLIADNEDFWAIFTPEGCSGYDPNYEYRLTSEAASKYLGTDNTQVGLYGTSSPFTNIPTNPQITSKEIATQTDANGKLSVKFTVEAQ